VKIKIECIIEVDDNLFSYGDEFPEEKEWFDGVMEDREHTYLLLYSNDIGDEIGRSHDFKYQIIEPK